MDAEKELAHQVNVLTLKLAKAKQVLDWIINFSNNKDLIKMAQKAMEDM